MASANRFIRWVAIPAVILAYAGYLVVDHLDVARSNNPGIYEAKTANMQQGPGAVTALVLGGSNAYFSVSARLMGELDGETWYNFALPNEGFSEDGYHQAIESQFADDAQRRAVKKIVYSSILPLRTSAIYEFSHQPNSVDVVGNPLSFMELRPDWPLDVYVRARFRALNGPAAPAGETPDAFGDIDFATVKCTEGVARSVRSSENPAVVLDFYDRTSAFLRRVFPNAEIIMVVPSEYVADEGSRELWKERLLALWAERHTGLYRLIVQPPIPDSKDLCTLTHHTNAIGREWRTRDLIARMEG